MKIFRLFYFLFILLFLFSLNIYACGNFHPFFGWPNMSNMMRWGWGGMFMGLFFLLFIGLIIYLMVNNVRTTKPETILKEETPLEILKKRYAKGEINQEEYDRIKKDLQG